MSIQETDKVDGRLKQIKIFKDINNLVAARYCTFIGRLLQQYAPEVSHCCTCFSFSETEFSFFLV